MTGKGARNKGFAFERLVASYFRALGYDAKRGLGQARHAELPDVQGVEPYWIECKRHRKPDIVKALEQAKGDAERDPKTPYKVPVAITKGDNAPAVATVSLEDFLWMVKQLKDYWES